MSLNYLLVDSTTGRKQRGSAVGGGGASHVDQDYDVAGSQSAFVTSNAFTVSTLIDVYRNGQLMREGSSQDYQRNAGTSTITFNYTVDNNAWVRIRIWNY